MSNQSNNKKLPGAPAGLLLVFLLTDVLLVISSAAIPIGITSNKKANPAPNNISPNIILKRQHQASSFVNSNNSNIRSNTSSIRAKQMWQIRPRQDLPTFGSCVTEGCVTVAGFILQNLDQDSNPCHDFYRYACGRFLDNTWLTPEGDDDAAGSSAARSGAFFRYKRNHRRPYITKKDAEDGQHHTKTRRTPAYGKAIVRVYDPYNQRTENIVDQVLTASKGGGGGGDSIRAADRKAAQFYSSCVRSRSIDKEASYAFIRQLFASVGGFYISTAASGTPRPLDWSIEETMVRVLPYLTSMGLIRLTIARDDYNSSRFALTLSPPSISPLTVMSLNSYKKFRNSDLYEDLRKAVYSTLTAAAAESPPPSPVKFPRQQQFGSGYYNAYRGAYTGFLNQLAGVLVQYEEIYNNYPPTSVDQNAINALADFELQLAHLLVEIEQNSSFSSSSAVNSVPSSLSSPTIIRLDGAALYTLCPAMDWLRVANRIGHLYNVSVLKLTDQQRLDPSMETFFDNLSIYSTSNRYISALCQLLRQTMQKPNGANVIQNYLSLSALMPYLVEMNDVFRKPYVDFISNLYYAARMASSQPPSPRNKVNSNNNNNNKKPARETRRERGGNLSPLSFLDDAAPSTSSSSYGGSGASIRCREMAEEFFGLVISRRYVERYFSKQAKREADQMALDIRQELVNSFNDSLEEQLAVNTTWMDGKTRQNAQKKAERILLDLGYPESLLDDNWLDDLVNDLEINDKTNHLQNLLAISRYSLKRQLARLDQVPDRKEWGMQAYENNAEYDFNENAIHVTAAAAGEPFFRPDFPLAWNYGALGYTLGHELTHSIDSSGALYDANGQIVGDWWSNATKREFQRRSECLIDQIAKISQETVARPSSNITTASTTSTNMFYRMIAKQSLDENIADNGGVKLAYNAFLKRIGGALKEPALPGLTLTNDQVFFLSIAQSYCVALSDSSFRLQMAMDEHAPNSIRVRSMMMNSQEWAAAYSCPADSRSPMNPTDKCQVW